MQLEGVSLISTDSWGEFKTTIQGVYQVNLADYYRQEAKRRLLPFHGAKLIKSRKLFIDDNERDEGDILEDYHDQIAVETDNAVETIVEAPESMKIKTEVKEKIDPEADDDFQVPDHLSALEDQIAMESLNKHLKKITQLPSGLKHKVESDLIRKLTTVEPKPKSKWRWSLQR